MNRHHYDRRLRQLETRTAATRLEVIAAPEHYPDEVPGIAEWIVYGAAQAAERCVDPGDEYSLVGIGRWLRLTGGELVSTVYAEA